MGSRQHAQQHGPQHAQQHAPQQQHAAQAAWTLSNPVLVNLQKECSLMAALRHPNVVQFMGVSTCPPAMVTEYCGKGALIDVLVAGRRSPAKAAQLTWSRRLGLLLDAAKGMLYLHRRGIIHRDLKSPNLLVDSTWRAKVADFNLSKIMDPEVAASGRSSLANMNPRWLAPEILLEGCPATPASDVFSFGVVMWEVLTWQLPWGQGNTWAVIGKLKHRVRLKVPPLDQMPGSARTRCFADTGLTAYIQLMERCWAHEAADRPGFDLVIWELRELMKQVVAPTDA